MSALGLTAGARSRLSDRGWLLTAAAGIVQLGALGLALAGASLAWLAALLAAGGVLLAGYLLAPRAIAAVRHNRGLILFSALLLAVALYVIAQLSPLRTAYPAPPGPLLAYPGYGPRILGTPRVGGLPVLALVAILLATAAGLVLNADAVRIWLGFSPHQRAPWREMTETEKRSGGIAWRAVLGVVLIGLAAFLAIGVAGRDEAGHPELELIVLLLVAAGAALVIGLPVAIGSLMRVDRDKAGSERERERQRFAAHLHDSVLQTLALVQRQAHDPVAVARLARRQEHALRAWMAGEAELLSETLVAALRDAVATVEDEHGITVELTSVGDRPLDAGGEELIAAAREALRNAARYGGGARVYVFAETTPTAVGVFVRDEGPGFDPQAVPAERRGIRDAIVGRMASAGGSATVESGPGEGTEVALRLCARKAGR
jgi:signal transduction histidine kinase